MLEELIGFFMLAFYGEVKLSWQSFGTFIHYPIVKALLANAVSGVQPVGKHNMVSMK